MVPSKTNIAPVFRECNRVHSTDFVLSFSGSCGCQAHPETLVVAESPQSKPREDAGMGGAPFGINGLEMFALFVLSHYVPYTFIDN